MISKFQYLWALVLLLLQPPLATGSSSSSASLSFLPDGSDFQCWNMIADVSSTSPQQAGQFCLSASLVDYSTQLPVTDRVGVSFSAAAPWQISDYALWIGTSSADLPLVTNKDGTTTPNTKNFPYTAKFNKNPQSVANLEWTVADTTPSFACPAPATSFVMVAQATLTQVDANTGQQVSTISFADGSPPPDGSGGSWTLSWFDMQCQEAAGQNLDPTTFGTNNPTSNIDLGTGPTGEQTSMPTEAGTDSFGCPPDIVDPAILQWSVVAAYLSDTLLDANFVKNQDKVLLGLQTAPPAGTSTVTVAQAWTDQANNGNNNNKPNNNNNNNNQAGPDQHRAMLIKADNVCYGVMATDTNTQDLTNSTLTRLNAFQQSCPVEERAAASYLDVPYQGEFALALADCANSCDSTNISMSINKQVATSCPLVLTGHGVGGSAAIVASMDLLDLSPTVVTFGAPRTTTSACRLVRPSSHYRFVNLAYVQEEQTSLFDPLPQLNTVVFSGLQHVGVPLVLDSTTTQGMDANGATTTTTTASLLVMPINDDSVRASRYDYATPDAAVMAPGQSTLYRDNLLALQSQYSTDACGIPQQTAWKYGHWCDQNDVCGPGMGRCRGFSSWSNSDVFGPEFTLGACAALLPNGSVCSLDGDCEGGVCALGTCSASATGPTDSGTGPTTDNNLLPDPTNSPNTNNSTCAECTANSDCAAGICYLGSCPNPTTGLLDEGCPCPPGEDGNIFCITGRCERDQVAFFCQAQLQNGETCDENSDCLSGYCDLLGGYICADSNNNFNNATDDGFTNGDDGLSNGQAGDSCTANTDCVVGLYCSNGSCVQQLADGGFCTNNAECQSGNCFFLVCNPKAAQGAVCTSNSECASGTCSFQCDTILGCGCLCPYIQCT